MQKVEEDVEERSSSKKKPKGNEGKPLLCVCISFYLDV